MDTENAIAAAGLHDENQLGMVLFLISEAAFFAFLIIAYVYYHATQEAAPNAVTSLDPLKTGAFTVALLASSFTIRRAEKKHAAGNFPAFRNWLLVTIALGAIFMVGQGMEYARLYAANVTISRNLFGSSFFTLTGFHGLHVLLGLTALCILCGLALKDSAIPSQSAVRTIALYWHFVDWVWVVIFSVIYLWALL